MMKAAFHKGGGKWSLVSKLIRAWTHGKYSHVELVFSDGVSYSSRSDGVSFKNIDYKKHPERWDFIVLPIDAAGEICVRDHARKHEKDLYDWIGIFLDRIFKTSIHRECDWWCSEIVAHVLGIEPELIDPSQLYKMLKAK